MRGAVAEPDPQPLALTGAQRGRRDAAVVGPGRELDARRDLDLLVARDQLPLAQHPAAGEPAGAAVVEVAQQLGGVEAVGGVVDRRARLEARVERRRCRGRARAGARSCIVCSCALLRARRRGEVHSAQLARRRRRPARAPARRASSCGSSGACRGIMACLNQIVDYEQMSKFGARRTGCVALEQPPARIRSAISFDSARYAAPVLELDHGHDPSGRSCASRPSRAPRRIGSLTTS